MRIADPKKLGLLLLPLIPLTAIGIAEVAGRLSDQSSCTPAPEVLTETRPAPPPPPAPRVREYGPDTARPA